MGLSSSKSSTKPVYSAQVEGAANTATGAYNRNIGNIQGGADAVSGMLPDLISKYQAGDSTINAAQDYSGRVLGGEFLDVGNPYLQSIIDQTNDSVRNQTQAAMGTRGQTNGSDYAGLIARNLAQNEATLRYNDYGTERNAMAQAAAGAPSLAAGQQIGLDAILASLNASTLPLQAAQSNAQTIGGLLGQYTNTKSTQPWGVPLLGAISGGANAAAAGGG